MMRKKTLLSLIFILFVGLISTIHANTPSQPDPWRDININQETLMNVTRVELRVTPESFYNTVRNLLISKGVDVIQEKGRTETVLLVSIHAIPVDLNMVTTKTTDDYGAPVLVNSILTTRGTYEFYSTGTRPEIYDYVFAQIDIYGFQYGGIYVDDSASSNESAIRKKFVGTYDESHGFVTNQTDMHEDLIKELKLMIEQIPFSKEEAIPL